MMAEGRGFRGCGKPRRSFDALQGHKLVAGGNAPGSFMDPLQGAGMDILDELFRSLESPALPDPW
jgi:hypothetical protein